MSMSAAVLYGTITLSSWVELVSPRPTPPPPPPAPIASHWVELAECESHGEWDYGPHSNWGSHLFEGGLQFHPDTWDGFKPDGYPDAAYQATPQQQVNVAERVQEAQGWRAWPRCSRTIGLRP